MMPSCRAPTLIVDIVALPGPVARNTSARLKVMRTGKPVRRDRATQSADTRTDSLPPKAPPTSVGTTRILLSGMPRIMARSCRCVNVVCVLAQTITLPSSRTQAASESGSRYP